MKPLTKVRMKRLPKRWSGESFGSNKNFWNIGDLGYIENVIPVYFFTQIVLVIVLENKIINCYTDAVEVIKD